MDTIFTLLQLFLITFAGYVLAKSPIQKPFISALKIIPFFVYFLLFSVAFEATEHLNQLSWQTVAVQGLVLSALLILANLLVCLAVYLPLKNKNIEIKTEQAKLSFKHILQDLSKTVLALALGVLCYQIFSPIELPTWASSWNVLLILMFLIGIDLAQLKLNRSQINKKMLLLPLLIIISSSLITLVFPLIFKDLGFKESLALAQGYGWYSMSPAMMNQFGNAHLGTLALIIDLSREIFAILFIQSLGRIYPNTAIGLGGATSMDATLGIIKESCGHQYMGLAVLSGLILSCFAPLLIALIMGF